MKNAYVSGSTGFIGRWLVKELKNQGINVIELLHTDNNTCLDSNKKTDKSRIAASVSEYDSLDNNTDKSRYIVAMSEYDNLDKILPKLEDCVFYHLAWDGVYGDKRMDAKLQFDNALGAEKAVIGAKKLGCRRIIELGSIMEKEVSAVLQADGLRPQRAYIYGEAKHFAHILSMSKAAEIGMDYICPVLTNPYGENDFSTRFITTTMKKIINNEPLEFTSGTQMYDFVYVGDVVKALVLLGDKGSAFGNYLIGSGQPKPLREFVKEMVSKLAPDREPLFGSVPYTGAQMSEEDFCIEKLVNDTEFNPAVSFEEGIRRTMNWLKNNML